MTKEELLKLVYGFAEAKANRELYLHGVKRNETLGKDLDNEGTYRDLTVTQVEIFSAVEEIDTGTQ